MKEIKFKDLEWYVLEENEDTTKLLLKDVLDEERIKRYCDDEWYINGYEVRMSENIRTGLKWEDTYIYKTILPNFAKDLNLDKESITLLNEEEALNLPDAIRSCDEWYWAKTVIEDNTYSYFAIVNDNDGSLDNNASNSGGVRPCLNLKSSILNQEKTIKPIEIQDMKITAESTGNYCYKISQPTKIIINKLNEIIKKVNELNEDK